MYHGQTTENGKCKRELTYYWLMYFNTGNEKSCNTTDVQRAELLSNIEDGSKAADSPILTFENCLQ